MKRKIAVLCLMTTLILLMAAAASCGKKSDSDSGDSINIVTTIFPPYDFAREIAGGVSGEKNGADIQMLLPPGGESHDYEPSLKDIDIIGKCDIFIYVGGDIDRWADGVLDTVGRKMKVLRLLDIVDPYEEAIVEGMETEAEEHEHDGPEYDEHVWTSLRNAEKITAAICEAMCAVNPDEAENYKTASGNYIDEMHMLDIEYESMVSKSDNKTIVFADRFPFRYLAEDYSLEYYAAFPGCSSDTEPLLSTVNFLVGIIKEKSIPVIFTIEFSNRTTAEFISEETGAEIKLLHSCHNVSREDFDRGVTYIDLMRNNLMALEAALQ